LLNRVVSALLWSTMQGDTLNDPFRKSLSLFARSVCLNAR